MCMNAKILCASRSAQRIKSNIDYERIDVFIGGSAISVLHRGLKAIVSDQNKVTLLMNDLFHSFFA